MATKFIVLIPFAYGSDIYNPGETIYELEDDRYVKSWHDEKLVKIVEKGEGAPSSEKEDSHENVQIDSHDVSDSLKGLTYKELQDRAKAAGIKYTGVKQKDLIKALSEVK